MRIAHLIASSSPEAALLALARRIALFYPELAVRQPTAEEALVLDMARAYGHAAGHFGVGGMRALLKAVDALDAEGLHAAALLDRVWDGVPARGEPEPPNTTDPGEWLDVAMERGLRLAAPPSAWWKQRY